MSYYVYKHTFPNGKVYIGITSTQLKQRWRNDGSGYLHQKKDGKYQQPLMARAVLKYGWDNILHEILFSGLTKEEAESKEVELIAEYKSDNPQFGYNIQRGGNIGNTSLGKPMSDEHKRKISEAKKGKSHTHTEITKKRISKTKGKPVLCIETGFIYDSTREAEIQTGINHSQISRVCNNKGLKTAGGMHWQWYVAESAAA